MFNEQVGGQIAWLLPLAAVGARRRAVAHTPRPRTDRARAGWILFGTWAVVHVVVFSAQQGIFHPYYVSALAPAVAALAGVGAGDDVAAGRARHGRASPRSTLAIVGTALASPSALLAPHAGLRAVAARRDPGGGGVAALGSVALRCRARSPRRRSPSRPSPARSPWLAGPGGLRVANRRPARSTATTSLRRRRRRAAWAAVRRRRRVRGRRLGQQRADLVPQGQPGLREVPRRRHGLADHRRDHHRHRQAGRHDRRLQRRRPGAHGRRARGDGRRRRAPVRPPSEGGGGGGPGGGNSDITSWVQEHGTAVTDAGTTGGTLYRVSA